MMGRVIDLQKYRVYRELKRDFHRGVVRLIPPLSREESIIRLLMEEKSRQTEQVYFFHEHEVPLGEDGGPSRKDDE